MWSKLFAKSPDLYYNTHMDSLQQQILQNIQQTAQKDLIDRPLYTRKFAAYANKPFIKVLTGMRRSGKTTIMHLAIARLLKEGVSATNIVYVNKEYAEFDFIKDFKDLNTYVVNQLKNTEGPKYVFLDEVQQVRDWEKAVVSFFAHNLADITISGSNSMLLSGQLATLLSGRYVTIPVYPLKFSEFIDFVVHFNPNLRGSTKEDLFDLFLRFGGVPAVPKILADPNVAYDYLRSLLDTILFKDVMGHFNIKSTDAFYRVVSFVFDNIGNPVSAKRIADFLKNEKISVSVDTVLDYLNYLQTAYLINRVRRYDIKGKRFLQLKGKFYLTDLGLRHGLLGYREKDISQLLENIVFNELRARGYEVSIGKINGYEIDFMAQKQGERKYIQVAYLLASEETIAREFGNLAKVPDHYEKIVVSLDRFFPPDHNGIKHKYLLDFLLEAGR